MADDLLPGLRGVRSDFIVAGTRCAGTLVLPEGVAYPPVILMAHGFAALRSFRLPAFARHFVRMGFAAYLFDYRCFGDSDGEPRHWVSPWRHLEDWRAAIAHLRTRDDIDMDRLVLWGSSFSGGHVLTLAAEMPRLAAVIAQVPHVDAMATLGAMSPVKALRATLHGLRDKLGSMFGADPHYIAVVGRPGRFAVMDTPEVWDGWSSIVPKGSTWENKVCARVMLEIPRYSPIKTAAEIRAPVLLIAGAHDTVTPTEAVRRTASVIPDCSFHCLDCDHFAPYVDPVFTENLEIQTGFLRERVLKASA